jgi:hypothetical protein
MSNIHGLAHQSFSSNNSPKWYQRIPACSAHGSQHDDVEVK